METLLYNTVFTTLQLLSKYYVYTVNLLEPVKIQFVRLN